MRSTPRTTVTPKTDALGLLGRSLKDSKNEIQNEIKKKKKKREEEEEKVGR